MARSVAVIPTHGLPEQSRLPDIRRGGASVRLSFVLRRCLIAGVLPYEAPGRSEARPRGEHSPVPSLPVALSPD